MANPNAKAIPRTSMAVGPVPIPPMPAAPHPKKPSANVPMNSAVGFFILLSLCVKIVSFCNSTAARLRPHLGKTLAGNASRRRESNSGNRSGGCDNPPDIIRCEERGRRHGLGENSKIIAGVLWIVAKRDEQIDDLLRWRIQFGHLPCEFVDWHRRCISAIPELRNRLVERGRTAQALVCPLAELFRFTQALRHPPLA